MVTAMLLTNPSTISNGAPRDSKSSLTACKNRGDSQEHTQSAAEMTLLLEQKNLKISCRWDLLDTSMGIMNLRCCCCCCFLIKLSSSKTCELCYRQAGRRRLLMTFEIVVVLECNCETGRGARVRQKQHTVTAATAETRQKAEGHVPTSH